MPSVKLASAISAGCALALLVPSLALARSGGAACVGGGPGVVQIGLQMSATVEAKDHNEHFTPMTEPITVKDGRGTGTITAVVGVRYPTADAHGQLVFFWHNKKFVGWDTNIESTSIRRVWSPAPGVFAVKYVRYKAKDPLCCPTGGTVTVRSAWSSDQRFISNGIPPKGPGSPVTVVKLH